MSDTLEKISRELGIALSPIKDALQSPERIRLFVQELGWNLPEGASSIGIDPSYLTNIISALERLSESEFQDPDSSSTLTNYSSTVSSIGNFIIHLSTQSSRIRNILDANFISSSNIDRDLPKRLF